MRLAKAVGGPGADEGVGPSIGRLLTLLAAPRTPPTAIQGALRSAPSRTTGRLLAAIAHHRIDGLAHRALCTIPDDAVDPWLRSTLRRRHQRYAAATLSQGLALAEILEELDRSRVRVTVMRGLRSVEGIYADPGARPFEDHDLLVLPSDLPRARRALERIGFAEQSAGLFRRGGTIVDLHGDPLGARRRPTRAVLLPLSAELLFSRSARGTVAGAPALILDPDDELLLLAIHVVKHSFDRLIRIADLAHLLAARPPGLGWDSLRRRAEGARALKPLAWAIESATILGADIPAVLILDNDRGTIEKILMRRVLDLRPLPYTGEVLMTLAARSLTEGARFLMDALLPSDEAPGASWAKAVVVPYRTVRLLRQATEQMSHRRRAR